MAKFCENKSGILADSAIRFCENRRISRKFILDSAKNYIRFCGNRRILHFYG
ncbi:hypothetical protein [Helicobacter sp. 23-1045]